MNISVYNASVGVFNHALENLVSVLQIGEAHATGRAPADRLLQQRLIFDMFPLVKQVQLACDQTARATARLAGAPLPHFKDDETTFAQVYERIRRTQQYLQAFQPEQINGSAERDVVVRMHGQDVHFTALSYLNEHALPNVFFHCTMVYAILRAQGAPVGKHDFLGLDL